jgi:hypothetical protein
MRLLLSLNATHGRSAPRKAPPFRITPGAAAAPLFGVITLVRVCGTCAAGVLRSGVRAAAVQPTTLDAPPPPVAQTLQTLPATEQALTQAKAHAEPQLPSPPAPLADFIDLVYELLDAHADTADLAAGLELDDDWYGHLEYLRALQREGREALAQMVAARSVQPAL